MQSADISNRTGLLKYFPKFLVILFFVEMWERFSYYGMRALLVLFLTSEYGFEDPKAYAIYSMMAALAFAGPVIAGIIADRLMGFRRMIMLGGLIMVAGHTAMAFVNVGPMFLYLGLGLIATGTGFFKGNAANLLGSFYKKGDDERDRGFTIFYVAVNVGSFSAAIACSLVAKFYGWHYGFALAGIGMLIGVLTFAFNQTVFGEHGRVPDEELINRKYWGVKLSHIVTVSIVASALLLTMIIYYHDAFVHVLNFFGFAVIFYFLYLLFRESKKDRLFLFTLFILMIFHAMFFAFEMQLASLINLFTERNVDKVIFGWEVPAAFSQAINPISIVIFGPMLAGTFVRMGHFRAMFRFGIGLFTMVICFAVLYFATLSPDVNYHVSYGYLLFAISMMGLGELFVAPLLQSLVTLLSPNHLRGFMMGFYLLSLAFANLGGFVIAKFASVPKVSANGALTTAADSLLIYSNAFYDIMLFNLVVIAVFALAYPMLNKVLHKIKTL